MDIHIPQGDYYLHGDDTFTSEDGNNHIQVFMHLQNKFTNYSEIVSRYGYPYIKLNFSNISIEFETDYTGYWKVAEMRPKIEVKDRYNDKELIEFISYIYEL